MRDTLFVRALAALGMSTRMGLKPATAEESKIAPDAKSLNEPSTPSVDNIVNAIKTAMERVDQIPSGRVADLDLEEVKRDLRKELLDVMGHASELAKIIANLRAVQKQIFQPVIKETRSANHFAKSGLVVAVLALILAFLPLMPTKHFTASSDQAISKQSYGNPTTLQPQDLLKAVGEVSGQSSYGKLRDYTDELEGVLSASKRDPTQIAKLKTLVVDELGEMTKARNNDARSLAIATYALLLCAAASNQWDEVRTLSSRWDEKSPNSASEFAPAIWAYEAEGLAHHGLIESAKSKYDKLRNLGDNVGATRFLSPLDFQRTEASELAASRIADLKFKQDLANQTIWIFGDDGGLRIKVANTLRDQGFSGVKSIGAWPGKTYHALYVYYKQIPTQAMREKWSAMLSGVAQGHRPPTLQYFAYSDDRAVREQFTSHVGVDVVIILP